MSYPHESIVLDWLKGVQMQYQDGGLWVDIPKPEAAKKVPHFYVNEVYRRRPVVLRYRLAQVGDPVVAVNNVQEHDAVAKYARFVKWISDWLEQAA